MVSYIIGTSSAYLLLGFLASQTYTYWRNHSGARRKDHPLFRTLVYVLVFIVVLETAIENITGEWYLALRWGDSLLFVLRITGERWDSIKRASVVRARWEARAGVTSLKITSLDSYLY